MKLFLNKKTIKFLLLYTLIAFLEVTFLFFIENEYHSIAFLSILQLILNMITLIITFKRNSMYGCIFLIFSWIFHCGQLIIKGYDFNVQIIFDVIKYASFGAIVKSFQYYYISQIFLVFGILISNVILFSNKKDKVIKEMNYKKVAFFLLIIGIIPRIYIDVTQLIGGISKGYSGVYSLIVPQIVQTFAFFFDASMIFYLFTVDNHKQKILFLFITIYKLLMMMTGARQEKLVFLIMWFYTYYFLIKEVKLITVIKLVIVGYFGISFIYSIGSLRVAESINLLEVISNTFIPNSKIFGELLAEFGSALNSLAITVYKIPYIIEYGFGKSYLAAILSIVPKLVSFFPTLNSNINYVSLFKGTTYFGGSYIGELYYNFGMYSSVLLLIFGYFLGKIQTNMTKSISESKNKIKKILAVIIGIYLILFIRGYFSDFVQKIVWLYLFVYLINKFSFKKER